MAEAMVAYEAEEREGWRIANDKDADNALEQIASNKREAQSIEEQYEAARARLAFLRDNRLKSLEDSTARLTSLLEGYAAKIDWSKEKGKSKNFLQGSIGYRKQPPKWTFDGKEIKKDDPALVALACEVGADDAVETKEYVKWGEWKKKLRVTVDGDVVDTVTGLVLEGLKAEQEPDKFYVKTEG